MSNPSNIRLELVPLPVSNVDWAIGFYMNKVGFYPDHDMGPSPALHLSVKDINVVRAV